MDLQGATEKSRLVALLLLAVYLIIVIALLPREIKFLSGVKQPHRTRFTVLDVLFQVFVLAVLIPPIATSMKALASWVTILVGFVGVLAVALWTGISRYVYTLRILLSRQAIIRETLDETKEHIDLEDDESD